MPEVLLDSIDLVKISGLDDELAITQALIGVDVVIHLAARVHAMDDTASQDAEYERDNHQGTISLARLAVNAGVRRFIFLSSIKVNGEERALPYSISDTPNPQDAYARSKYSAESDLLAYGKNNDLEVVVIRPPLVYGEGVKANFLQLIRWVDRGVPLPLAGLSNQRSLVSVVNLVDLLSICIAHPDARGQVFLVADDEAVSSSQLIQAIAQAYGVKPRLFYCPQWLLRLMAKLIGRSSSADRLLGSLAIDTSATKRRLDWQPPTTLRRTLLDMARTEGESRRADEE
ncbi:MAG: nucleoside-diphosphate-sugar epimerase [Motiliproteus sp.]|jgi:nucleoside-diphosphate-sugar epimerase